MQLAISQVRFSIGCKLIYKLVYCCSGETAFQTFLKGVGWAKNPMIHRYDLIHEDVPITVMYGEDSWIDPKPGLILHEKRGHTSYINIDVSASFGWPSINLYVDGRAFVTLRTFA